MDGGKSWQKVLFVNDGVGAIDLVMSRRNPMTLYAAMYEKHRMPWQLVLGGPGTGIYRTDDGGTKWQRLEGGLPTGTLGRIGLDINWKNPNVLYAVVENVNNRPEGVPGAVDACTAAQAGRGGPGAAGARGAGGAAAGTPARGAAGAAAAPAAQPGRGRGGAARVGNEVFRSDDGGKTWRKTHGDDIDVGGGKAPYSFNQIRMDPNNPDHVIINSDQMYVTEDGGKTWSCSNSNGFFRGVFGDYRTMWWDPEDPNRIMIGSDGGLNVSYDGGRTADYFLNMRIGEVYAIGVDMDDPYNVYGGMQDHDSWKGPSNSPTGRITLEHWTTVGPGDGMYNQVDPTDSRWVYNTREMGNHGRFDQLDRPANGDCPAGAAGPSARAVQLGRANRPLAAQPANHLCRRRSAVPIAQPRRRLGADQRRSDDERDAASAARTPDPCRTARSRPSRNRRSSQASSGSGPMTARCSSRRITARRGPI